MSDQRGEISDVNSLTADQPVGDGDTTPPAEDTNQVADGEPKNYGTVNVDEDLARRTEHDDLRPRRDPEDSVESAYDGRRPVTDARDRS